MNVWDEDRGYYCLLIAIFCDLNATEAGLMYDYGPSHPICQRFLKRKVRSSETEHIGKKESGKRMRELRQKGYALCEIANAFDCCPSTVKERIKKADEKTG